jgi:WD40 repeat protein
MVRFWGTDGMDRGTHRIPPSVPLAFSTDGRLLLSSGDKTVNIWDFDDERRRTESLRGHSDAVASASFDKTNRFVLTVSYDETARLWNLTQTLAVRLGDRAGVSSLAFSADSLRIVTTSEHAARVYDTNFSLAAELVTPDALLDAQFSPDGRQIAAGSVDGTARIWTIGDKSSRVLRGHTDWVYRASFSPDGRHVLTASADRSARMWSLQGEQELTLAADATMWNPQGPVVSSDGHYVLTTELNPEASKARVWELPGRPGQRPSERLTIGDPLGRATLAPDGRHVVSSDTGQVRVWDLGGRATTILSLKADRERVNGIPAAFSSDSNRVFTISPVGRVALSDLGGHTLQSFDAGANAGGVMDAAGRLVVTAGEEFDPRLRLWNWAGQLLAAIPGESVTMSPDGSLLVSGVKSSGARRVWPLSVAGYLRRLNTLRLPCLTLSQLREGLLLDDADARARVSRCDASRRTGTSS